MINSFININNIYYSPLPHLLMSRHIYCLLTISIYPYFSEDFLSKDKATHYLK